MNECLLDNKEILSSIRIELSPNTNIGSISYFIYDGVVFVGSFCVSSLEQSNLIELFIERKYRRQGIGSLIINQFKIANLQCTTWNNEGIAFYKSNGFKINKADMYLIDFKRDI